MSETPMSPKRIEQLLEQRKDALLYLAVLVERMGGEVKINPADLLKDRVLKKDTVGFTGVIVLRTEKP